MSFVASLLQKKNMFSQGAEVPHEYDKCCLCERMILLQLLIRPALAGKASEPSRAIRSNRNWKNIFNQF